MIKSLYFDKFDIYRNVKYEDDYGATKQGSKKISESVKCSLSQLRLHSTTLGTVNQSISRYKLFCASDVDVRQNDELVVYKGGTKYHFKASKPIKYNNLISHQEIMLEEIEVNEDDL